MKINKIDPVALVVVTELIREAISQLAKEWMNPREAAEYLGVHYNYLERRRKRGEPPLYSRMGKRDVRYNRGDLNRFLIDQRVVSRPR